ncbi:methionyl-tRNA formyltransferase [Candidatus Kaiserbacteria bacterium RIFCSPHIGHO2_01_FULL_50_13]|uniref:Methionyl-tRNA formyltransferase n=1 Tax=Candidatus Kaiserbacteria bacterium RIFCSPLOWO2_01_FULL_50_24 TaxID=1798507 RepID=A0A1F6EIL1_9BACT|nr:MAG: methionyl-tRNA formyltransferase [Candidatus Kaiserbacteria bacterium RIFCSPHIGHO2_01_FULL_50_13]OGG73474.1 MAG: methionyl-tRNA formyltransferase [Candidatus Kaiserbacteria bacterium RIFCSPLOWO2_01_FULL_50_24]OGG80860.1 MAG: methionyl-tRNA formyltransferase [Candidatus Kaiserbacteria bacterium RIFCSPLOWO2_02_FULL_51_13]
MKFVFFGTGNIAVGVLEELSAAHLVPALITTAPDKPAGRGKKLTPPPVKAWANMHSISAIQPEKLDSQYLKNLRALKADVFVVADYGKILPKELLKIPKHGTLNMHPSLLPRLRGPSPIRTAILNDDKNIGVTIMLMDEKMDHGPIVAQRPIPPPQDWPPHGRELDELLAHGGGKLLAEILPTWLRGDIVPQPQNHDLATYSEKIKKEDGLVNLAYEPRKNLLKVRAYDGSPGAYAFFEKNGKKLRVRITDAHLDENGSFTIDRVIPEGKKEMSYEEFLRGTKTQSRS